MQRGAAPVRAVTAPSWSITKRRAALAGSPWPASAKARRITSYDAVEAAQYGAEFGFPAFPIIPFTVIGRQQIELAAGGNGSWIEGVDFARELRGSPYLGEVKALYPEAGLDLRADLRDLTEHADIAADPRAVAWLRRTSVPTGRLQVPVLTMHVTAGAQRQRGKPRARRLGVRPLSPRRDDRAEHPLESPVGGDAESPGTGSSPRRSGGHGSLRVEQAFLAELVPQALRDLRSRTCSAFSQLSSLSAALRRWGQVSAAGRLGVRDSA
jgi:hypothetical protein